MGNKKVQFLAHSKPTDRINAPLARKPRAKLWVWLIIGTTALLAVFVVHSPIFKTLVDEIVSWITNTMNDHPLMGAVVFFLFSAVSAMLAFASSIVLVPAANLVWGKLITFLLLWGGWLFGAMIAFGIGRLASPLLSRLNYKETLEKYQQYVSSRMNFWAVLLFCIAVPSEVPGYLLGGAHYPFLKFIAAMATAEAIYALGIVIAGESLVVDMPFSLVGTIGVLIVIACSAGLLMRKLKRRTSMSSFPKKGSDP
jgi:uncharacterized membrane protein YdjX (TVP38/TMEM64 family)